MSRSYKKHPIIKESSRGSNKLRKRIANKAVRHHKGELNNGAQYKKIYSSYDISDYSFSYTWDEWKDYRGDSQTERDNWERFYYRK